MISYSNFVTFYETVLECNQAIRQLQGVMEIDFKFSPIFDTYENMGWYYACLFTNDPKEMDTLEEDFWEMIGFFIENDKLSQKEKNIEYTEEYINLLQQYGSEKDWEEWHKRERGEIPLGE